MLHRTLFALGASADEAHALALAGRLDIVEGGLDDVLHRIHLAEGGPLALRDVLLLGIESEIWWHATHDPRMDVLLCRVMATRAHQSLMRGAVEDIDDLARRAVRIALSTGDATPAAPAIFAACWVGQRRPGGAAGAARTLGRWSERMGSPRMRAWLLTAQGIAIVRSGDSQAGIDLLERVEKANRAEQWSEDGYFLVDLVEARLLAGQPERAAETFATVGAAARPALESKVLLAGGKAPSTETLEALSLVASTTWPTEQEAAQIEQGIEAVRRGEKARFF